MTEVVNGESVLFTKSLRSLDTRPLRVFIITSICSFIACSLGSAALVCLVHYCPLASLVPFVRNCLLDFPLERCVLRPFDVAIPPDHGIVL